MDFFDLFIYDETRNQHQMISLNKSTQNFIGDKTMANINIENISELDLNGNELFEDSESFIDELNDDSSDKEYIEKIMGGLAAINCSCCCCSCRTRH